MDLEEIIKFIALMLACIIVIYFIPLLSLNYKHMKKIIDIVFSWMYAMCFMMIFLPNSIFKEYWSCLIGPAIGLGAAYCIGIWNREKIEKLEEEIKKLKR